MKTNREIIIAEINNRINHDGECYFVNDGSGSDSFTTNHLNKIRRLYDITKNTEILYCYKVEFSTEGDFFTSARNYIYSVLILEDGIHFRKVIETTGWDKKPDFIEYISWDNIDDMDLWYNVDKDTQEKEYFIKIYNKNNNDFLEVPTELFGNFIEDGNQNGNLIIEMILAIKEKINTLIDENDNVFDELWKEICDAYEQTDVNHKHCLELIKKFINTYNYDELKMYSLAHFYTILYWNSYSLLELGNPKEALKILNQKMADFEYFDELRYQYTLIYGARADLRNNLNDLYGALQDYQIALNYSDDDELQHVIFDELEKTYSLYKDSFLNLKYDERKILLINQEIKPSLSSDLMTLKKSNLPENIKFPISHPKIQEVYIAHPYIKESYLPFSTFEESLFNDRFEEFSYFIQCLGAKSMTIRVVKENELTSSYNSSKNIDAKISAMKIKADGSMDLSNNTDSNEVSGSTRTRTQKFNPTKKPYIPKNLLWYPHETSWHRLYQQRINGNILHHHDFMSSKNSYSISDNEKSRVKVAFENFYIGAEVEINRLVEHNFSQSETIEWQIEIEFESIENLLENNIEQLPFKTIDNNSTSLSNYEKEYLEEVKFMFEDDGIIDEKERRVLNRLKDKLKISDEKADYLENQFLASTTYSENEKEYIEEYKEFLNDGEITEKERRILNRFATRLCLTPERVAELENSLT